MPHNNRYPKWERLCNVRSIATLFEAGESCFNFPLKIYFIKNSLSHNRVLITVPKRGHKRAVDRNLLKRRIKESWRVVDKESVSVLGMDLAIVYIGTTIADYHKIYKSLSDGLEKIKERSA